MHSVTAPPHRPTSSHAHSSFQTLLSSFLYHLILHSSKTPISPFSSVLSKGQKGSPESMGKTVFPWSPTEVATGKPYATGITNAFLFTLFSEMFLSFYLNLSTQAFSPNHLTLGPKSQGLAPLETTESKTYDGSVCTLMHQWKYWFKHLKKIRFINNIHEGLKESVQTREKKVKPRTTIHFLFSIFSINTPNWVQSYTWTLPVSLSHKK